MVEPEPSVQFDWDEVERRLDGVTDPSTRDAEVAERAIRAFATMVLPKRGMRMDANRGRSLCLRMAVALYLLRIPGHERFKSLADVAEWVGVSRVRANEIAHEIAETTGLPHLITRTHRKRRSKG